MKCPKCNASMEDINEENVHAFQCSGCGGFWFRDGTHEIAKEMEHIVDLDDGSPHAASAYNELRDIDCPECNQKMIKMIDRSQYHIEFESCRHCYGVFFDAGEFKDFANHTLIERVTQAFSILKSNLYK